MNGLCNDKVVNDLDQMFLVKSTVPIFFQYPLGSHETTHVTVENGKMKCNSKEGKFAFIIGADVSFMDSEEILNKIESQNGCAAFSPSQTMDSEDLNYIGLAFCTNDKITLPLIEVYFTRLELYTLDAWKKKEPEKTLSLDITEEGFSFEESGIVDVALYNNHLQKFTTELDSIPFDSEFYFFVKERQQIYVATFTYEV